MLGRFSLSGFASTVVKFQSFNSVGVLCCFTRKGLLFHKWGGSLERVILNTLYIINQVNHLMMTVVKEDFHSDFFWSLVLGQEEK